MLTSLADSVYASLIEVGHGSLASGPSASRWELVGFWAAGWTPSEPVEEC